MENSILNRQELYHLVWDQPISKLAKKFKIEPKRLKDICIENEIPLPNRGYWSKVRFNKKVDKTPLPKIENDHYPINLKTRKFRTDYHKRAFELEQRKDLKFKVPGRIVTYHPMVRATKKLLENIDNSKEKLKFWQVSQEHNLLPIHTDSILRSRALRFMDTLIRLVEAMGHTIRFEYSSCHVAMFGQKAEINLRQKVYRIREKDESGWSMESWEQSNKLEFQVGPSFNHKRWIDTDKRKLEECLPEIIAWIEKDCKYWHDLRAQQAIEENKRLLDEQKLAAIKEEQELEQAKIDQLFTDAEIWDKALLLERYVNEMEKQAILENQMNKNIEDYIAWAKKVIIRLNPIKDKKWLKQ
ncbi:hypothetical protein [Kriegella aquimaris]|uniref:Uncharacterized protein n=1 Tax=Kriegella aquimaris TaxID=192904 RepID=A0A1G9LDW5_9FLAO|nr:hypothetical protein [Kriegella aquimaris]SDL60074.1 hypothetical protein SAMN04488514_10223 [Kriegella aquimaris]